LLDLIGYSTIPEDTKVAQSLLEKGIAWAFTVPAWLSLLIAAAVTAWLIWWAWRPVPTPITSTSTSAEADLIKQQRLAAKDKRVAASAAARPLTPHAVEQKVKVIDQAIELMRGAPMFLERLSVMFRDPWQTSGKSFPEMHSFSDQIGAMREDLIAFAKPIDALRLDCVALYPDVAVLLAQTYYPVALERLAEYQNACRDVEAAVSKGAAMSDLNFMYSQFVGRTEQAMKNIIVWREDVRQKLIEIRQLAAKRVIDHAPC